MSLNQVLLDELKRVHAGEPWHGHSLKSILAGLGPEQAAAKSIPGAHSIWEIVHHLRGWQNVCIARLEGRALAEPEEGDFPPATEINEIEWNRSLAALDETHARLIDKIGALSDARLLECVPGKDYTIEFLLRGIVQHHVYHAGQVAILRKNV